jgi:hypothetical protein
MRLARRFPADDRTRTLGRFVDRDLRRPDELHLELTTDRRTPLALVEWTEQ